MPPDPSFRDPRDHPWWQHVPRAQRRSCRRQLRLLRLREWWERRSSRSLVMLLIYLAFCLGLLVVAQPHLALTAAPAAAAGATTCRIVVLASMARIPSLNDGVHLDRLPCSAGSNPGQCVELPLQPFR